MRARVLARFAVIAMLCTGCEWLGAHRRDAWIREQTVYLHQGPGAGPVLVTRQDGTVADERRYEPFGAPIDGALVIEQHNGLNKPVDATTQWSYHGARWMAPLLARWPTPDPLAKAPSASRLGTPWDLSPYHYARQSPITYWDPDGREPLMCEPPVVAAPVVEVPVGSGFELELSSVSVVASHVYDAASVVDTGTDALDVVHASAVAGGMSRLGAMRDPAANATRAVVRRTNRLRASTPPQVDALGKGVAVVDLGRGVWGFGMSLGERDIGGAVLSALDAVAAGAELASKRWGPLGAAWSLARFVHGDTPPIVELARNAIENNPPDGCYESRECLRFLRSLDPDGSRNGDFMTPLGQEVDDEFRRRRK